MQISELHAKLFQWWRQHGRVLPWREKIHSRADSLREESFSEYFESTLRRDPYRVVVAEMMLQQTQVERVLPKYEVWMKKWPRVTDLASASLADVLIFWQGLGYNRRARFLWLLAKDISEKNGIWPQEEKELRALPGIGEYTARAVQSFSLGQQVGVVDTNVKRIFMRVLSQEKDFFRLADEIVPEGLADPWNQALMDFGALICTAKNPHCSECPLQELCEANISARKKGFSDYAEELQKIPRLKKTKQIAFKDTNRFFRGRIIDELRSGGLSLDTLHETMVHSYGLNDDEKFKNLLEGLKKEGLIQMTNDYVSL